MHKESANTQSTEATQFAAARDEFVVQWDAIGSAWGINRTMAQIHALLITSPVALTTDRVMGVRAEQSAIVPRALKFLK